MSLVKTLKFRVGLLVGIAMVVIMLTDMMLPLGVAGGVLYVIPVLLTFWLGIVRVTWLVVAICIILIAIGFLYSPLGGELWKVWFNRILSITTVLVTGFMVTRYLSQNIKLNIATKKSERLVKSVKESQEQYVTVVENGSDIITMFNSIGNIIFVSPNIETLLGYKPKELIGFNFLEFVHVNDKALIKRMLESDSKTNIYRHKLKGKHNKYSDVETIFNALIKENERIIIGTIRIITDEKIVQEKLIKSESSLKEAQRITKMGNWSLDVAKNELEWSDQVYRLFGLEPQGFAATYEAFLNAVHPEDRDMVDQAYKKSLVDKAPYEIVHRLLLKNGEIKYVFETCSTTFNENGEAINSVGTIQDVTELEIASIKLKKSIEEKDILLKEVHHRVKNNLQIISGLLEMQAYRSKSKVVKKELGESKSRIKSIAILHEQLYQSSDLSSVDLRSYVEKLFVEIHSSFRLEEREIEFNVNIKDVFLDINKAIPIGLILNELVTNAVKHAFGDKKGNNVVLVEAEENDNGIYLLLKDNGRGMKGSVEEIEKKSLGVKIIKALVKQLNGAYKIDTNSNGTTVKLNIPT